MRERKTTALRDFCLVRLLAIERGSYFSKERVRAFFSPIRLERLLNEGWIVEISPGWYRIKSIYKICIELDIKIKRRVTVRVEDAKQMARQFKAYCLAQAEQYVGYRRKMRNRKKKSRGEGAKNPKAQNHKGIACRYMQKMTGLSPATVSRLRRRYNGVYSKYRKIYCDDFDKLNYQTSEQVAWWVSQSECESEKNIFYDKKKKRYRRVVGTDVQENSLIGDFSSINSNTIYTLLKKHRGVVAGR